MSEPTLTTEIRGHVFAIGLNRPAKRNAFNLQMLRELSEAYGELERNADLRCALLYPHGQHFTAGLDLAEVGPAVASGAALFPEGGLDPLDLGEPRRTKPVVCAVRGWCLTIGIELLLASDLRLAGDDTRFGQIEVKRGIMPFGGATLRFPQVAGWGNAMRYLLTGDEFDAAEALRIGVVSEVVPAAELEARGMALAEAVARQAPLAVRETLHAARVAVDEDRAAALASLMDRARALMHTEDAAEGVRSFIERREGRFRGR